jgi:hypothetical protein
LKNVASWELSLKLLGNDDFGFRRWCEYWREGGRASDEGRSNRLFRADAFKKLKERFAGDGLSELSQDVDKLMVVFVYRHRYEGVSQSDSIR